MPRTLTPERGLDLQVPATARPDFLLPRRDMLAELGSVIGKTKHPGSKPRFAHRHNHLQAELRQISESQTAVQSENQIQAKIEGIETVDSPLMAAAFFAVIGSGEWGKKNVSRLLAAILVLAGCTGVIRQESTPTPESPPAVTVVTNTPVFIDTPTATLTATPTETPFFGAGGPELPGGAPDQIRVLLETGMNLPITDCVTTPETGGNKEVWDDWIRTLVENGANQTAIDELKATISAKLGSQGISYSTRTLELCGGGDGGWSLVIRDKSSGLFWWSFDLEENRFADRPDRVFNDRDWQFRPMPREGLKSGLEVEILMVNGWPLAIAVNPEGRPIQHFDPVLRKFINFYPDTPTPTETATATPTITNTPRPTAIPATLVPPTQVRPTETLTPPPTPQPEGFISTRGVLPTREELIGCATGVNSYPREIDYEVLGILYHSYRNKVLTNSSGVLTFEDGRVQDIHPFVVARIIQIMPDGSIGDVFNNAFSMDEFAELIKPGDYVSVTWKKEESDTIALYCNAR